VLTGAILLTELLEDELTEEEPDEILKDESLDDELLTGPDEGALELTEDDAAEFAGGVLDEPPPPPPQPVSIKATEKTIIIVPKNLTFIS